jgi:SAM-dependent methyltransferase
VQFLKGTIEDIPLSDGSVDVLISNCVINLSVDKPKVLTGMFGVLAPGGRIGISDVVAEDRLTPGERADRGSYAGCIAGALSRAEYVEGLSATGLSTSPTGSPMRQLTACTAQSSKPEGRIRVNVTLSEGTKELSFDLRYTRLDDEKYVPIDAGNSVRVQLDKEAVIAIRSDRS